MQWIKKAFGLASLALASLLATALLPSPTSGQDGKVVSVISTASLNGELAPCG